MSGSVSTDTLDERGRTHPAKEGTLPLSPAEHNPTTYTNTNKLFYLKY